jgi:2-polyprenyl-3-methyl-5-hydroxy-6-metoxy-1,4-benzoquinol methylase
MCGTSTENAKVLGRRMNRSQGIRPKRKVGIATTIMQCQSCTLIFSNPLPIPISISQHYGTPPEKYWNENYFNINENYFKTQINSFFELYGTRENLQALDIGAGIGKCMKSLENNGFIAYGLEPSEPFYTRALNKMGIPAERLKLSSIEDVEYSEEQFDFVTFGAVLEHLYDPSLSIQKALSWLKPNGLIHIEVPSSTWLTNRIYNLIYRLQGLDYVGNISPMHTPFHLYEFGLQSFKIHAQKNGYEIVKHHFIGCETYLPKVIDPIVKPLMEKTNTGMQLEIWLRKSA